MAFQHSHQLVEILRATLRKMEEDPSIDSTEEDIAQLRRILLRWIAEAETADFQPAAVSSIKSAPPVSVAVKLASTLVSSDSRSQPGKRLDGPDSDDPPDAAA